MFTYTPTNNHRQTDKVSQYCIKFPKSSQSFSTRRRRSISLRSAWKDCFSRVGNKININHHSAHWFWSVRIYLKPRTLLLSEFSAVGLFFNFIVLLMVRNRGDSPWASKRNQSMVSSMGFLEALIGISSRVESVWLEMNSDAFVYYLQVCVYLTGSRILARSTVLSLLVMTFCCTQLSLVWTVIQSTDSLCSN